MTELGAFKRTEFLCITVLRVASGPRVKLANCKSALNLPVVYSTDRSMAVVPVLVLLFVLCLTLCHFVLVFFSLFSIAITSLGEERANLSAFRTFVRFVLVWICRFPLSSSFWCRGSAAVCDCGTPWTFLLPLFSNAKKNEIPSSLFSVKVRNTLNVCFSLKFRS